ncbi:MAG: phosphoribosyltransferase family protein [Archaeoglobaceae archaeon]
MTHFRDRRDGGKKLANSVEDLEFDYVAAIPRGGVAVGVEVAKNRNKPLLVVGVRKIPIPWSPEAGFGAVAEDGSTFINEKIFDHLGLSVEETEELAEEVRKEVERRIKTYREEPLPDMSGKTVLLVDDGFASGYTAIAAIELLKNKGATVYAAAPCSPSDTVKLLEGYADKVVVIKEQKWGSFAVASYYHEFSDLSDEEVVKMLSELSPG